MNTNEVSKLLELRLDILSRVLPLTDIANRCRVENTWLVVQGQLGTYRIEVTWGQALRVSDSGVRHLTIPQKLLDQVQLDFSALPIEMDYRSETILRKAHVLANDWNIDLPELIRQLG